MFQSLLFDSELIRRYDKAGPRYTSYPTALQFHNDFDEAEYRAAASATNVKTPSGPKKGRLAGGDMVQIDTGNLEIALGFLFIEVQTDA